MKASIKSLRTGLIAVTAIAAFTANISQAAPVVGSSSGVFVNPLGPVGMVASGMGSSHFAWGSPLSGPQNSLSFSGEAFAIETGDVFSFGSLAYYNGTIYSGTEANSVGFNVALALTTPVAMENFDFYFALINSPNTSDPVASADIVQLASSFAPQSFSYAGYDYTLEFLGFGSIAGPGLVSTIDQFHVLEGGTASAQLLGRITVADVEAVPEPGTLALVGLGFVGLGFAARRRS
jgi:PEP-CTERM motif